MKINEKDLPKLGFSKRFYDEQYPDEGYCYYLQGPSGVIYWDEGNLSVDVNIELCEIKSKYDFEFFKKLIKFDSNDQNNLPT